MNKEENLTLIRNSREEILQSLVIGSPAAESDQLLEGCRIETPVFGDILNDQKDLILGPKGSGKSSLYAVFTKYIKHILIEKRIVVIGGVTKVGSSIYTDYQEEFKSFLDIDFRNFWNVLLINLIYRNFVLNSNDFLDSKISDFEKLCQKNKVPLENSKEDSSLIWKLIKNVRNFKLGAKYKELEIGAQAELKFGDSSVSDSIEAKLFPAKLKTRSILEFIENYLTEHNLQIWIMIDQLDEAFERYSTTEKKALHGLLSEAISFNSEKLKLKIFLRDDIFDLVTEYQGIVNVDHLRISDSLNWENIDLLKLILKRLLHNNKLKEILGKVIGDKEIDLANKEECLEVFYYMFPEKAKNNASTWNYILNELSDGKSFVTPRDLIVFLDKARELQMSLIRSGEGNSLLFSKKSIEDALTQCSKNKITNFIKSEFHYLSQTIDKFKFQYNKYNEEQLQKVLGKNDFQKSVGQLISIGFLYRRGDSETYWIAPLYRRGLEVRNRRQPKKQK